MPDEPVTHTAVTQDAAGAGGADPTASAPAGAPRIPDYEVTGRLGEGGMGVVWRAVQRSTRREVALKLLSPATIGSERAKARFEREVELAARLEHPHIARVYDAGVCEGLPYYAMQLVDGVPLDAYVKTAKAGRDDILRLMRDVCAGVQHAHQRGIIHRDLKPSNILVDAEGRPIVVDFGLAKATAVEGAEAMTVSLEGQVAGTPAYMSPEQAAGKSDQIDTRSDVYSLGVILYRLLIGRPPHDLTGSTMDVLRRIADQEPRKPRHASKESSRIIDTDLETLLMKCLSKDADRRYDAAGALAQDIDNYLRGEPLLARRPTATYVITKRLKRHRVAASITALVLLGVVGSLAYAKFRPARYPLLSNPGGAAVLVNGKVKSGCTQTPCVVDLPPGTHEISLSMPGFEQTVRRIEVDWGRAKVLTSRFDAEPVTLTPRSRFVEFASQPAGAVVVIRDADSGEAVDRAVTPGSVKLPPGSYRLAVEMDGYQSPQSGQTMTVTGSVVPLDVRIDLQPR